MGRWVPKDRMPVPFRRLPSGMILIDVVPAVGDGPVVVYAGCRATISRLILDRQVAWLTQCATGAGMGVGEVVAGCALGSTVSVRSWRGSCRTRLPW